MTSSETINHISTTRRTIKPKMMANRDIPLDILQQMLENANWAPTHGMTEPWRFSVFMGAAREKLASFLAETYKAITPVEIFKPNKYQGMRENAMLAPAVIAIGMKRQPSKKISELDEIQAVACAVQNMHLTATAHGLGGFWSTNIAAVSSEMAAYIGLDKEDRALGLFYVGYPKVDWPTGSRQPMEDKVRWVQT